VEYAGHTHQIQGAAALLRQATRVACRIQRWRDTGPWVTELCPAPSICRVRTSSVCGGLRWANNVVHSDVFRSTTDWPISVLGSRAPAPSDPVTVAELLRQSRAPVSSASPPGAARSERRAYQRHRAMAHASRQADVQNFPLTCTRQAGGHLNRQPRPVHQREHGGVRGVQPPFITFAATSSGNICKASPN